MFHQLKKHGHPLLDPVVVTKEGFLSVRTDQLAHPQVICAMLHDHK
jgi:hypothetical protein